MPFIELVEIADLPFLGRDRLKVRIVELRSGSTKRVAVDVRVFVNGDSYVGPTKKGVVLDIDDVHELIKALTQVEQRAAALGLRSSSNGSTR